MATILKFPIERTLAAAARRRRSRELDVAIEHAEQWHRIHLASKQVTLDLESIRRDQVRAK